MNGGIGSGVWRFLFYIFTVIPINIFKPYQAAFPIWTPAWPMCMDITSLILDISYDNL